jgi:predicted ATPase
MPQESKQLRVMAGPNGSGKTTVVQYIQQNYYCGPFINPDILQQQLLLNKAVFLSAFGLKSTPAAFNKFSTGIGKSWHGKAASKGASIQLSFLDNKMITGEGEPGSYNLHN